MKKMSSIAGKIIFIGIIVGLLVIANVLIGVKLNDRESTKDSAVSSISDAAGGPFVIRNIKLSVPYVHHVKKINSKGVAYTDSENGTAVINAKYLNYEAELESEERNLGIYSAPIFSGKIKIDGEFDNNLVNNADYTYYFNKAKLNLILKDKSIVEIPVFTLNGKKLGAEFDDSEYGYVEFSGKYNSFYTVFPCKEGANTFSTELSVRGAESFSVNVCSKQIRLSVVSDWKSPGFADYSYLPTYNIDDNGFTAEWLVPFDAGDGQNSIGFNLTQPVDIYKMLDRAIKYGFLFIVVPFIVLFLFEIFLGVNLHPMNYLLCGAASVVFFLLLLSVAEHIPFGASYLISAVASGTITSLYVASITGKIKTGLEMVVTFAAMYGYLFFSLKSEDYALLIGSIFTFGVIAALMYFTRKVDWNNLKNSNLKSNDKV